MEGSPKRRRTDRREPISFGRAYAQSDTFRVLFREGMTLVPLRLYFNERGMAKLQLGIAKGKKLHDKRATEAKRDWQRQKARVMRERG